MKISTVYMPKTLIIANWKMNPVNLAEAKRLFRAASNAAARAKRIKVVVCPPFPYLSAIKQFNNLTIELGAQNCFWEDKGAFTGEVSAKMLRDLGCKYVIVGHSERRLYFGETDETVSKKIKSAVRLRLRPILCVGETQGEKQRGEMTTVLKRQIERGLQGLERKGVKSIIIAYEPVWAIGTGNNCSPEDAESAGLFIKKIIARRYSRLIADNIPILYGGSVNSQNAASYVKEAGLQGLLVGGASLDPKEFAKIVKSVR